MPTIVNRKTGEAWNIPINKPATHIVNVSMVSKENPKGESPLAASKPVEEPKK